MKILTTEQVEELIEQNLYEHSTEACTYILARFDFAEALEQAVIEELKSRANSETMIEACKRNRAGIIEEYGTENAFFAGFAACLTVIFGGSGK